MMQEILVVFFFCHPLPQTTKISTFFTLTKVSMFTQDCIKCRDERAFPLALSSSVFTEMT